MRSLPSRLVTATLLVAVLVFAAAPADAGPLDRAREAAEKKDWSLAADLFQQALAKSPEDREVVVGFVNAVVKGAREDLYPNAEDAVTAQLGRDAKDWEAVTLLGELYMGIAATKSDPQLLRGYYADATQQFERVGKAKPNDERAAVGLAKSYYYVGDFQRAVEVLDTFLDRKAPSTADALFWKGEVLYLQATDAYKQAGTMTDEVTQLFRRAQGAYTASTAADSGNFKAWLQLAYAAHYLNDTTASAEAYERALTLDPESELPMRGLATLLTNDQDGYTKLLARLESAHPKHPWVLLYRGTDHVLKKRYDAALVALKKALEVVENPAVAQYYAGLAYDGKKEFEKAEAAYTKALEARPDYEAAAGALENRVRQGKDMQQLVTGLTRKGTAELIAAYEDLFRKAPENPWIRNNLGFILRELWVRNRSDKSWRPVLDDGVSAYEGACRIIGEWDPSRLYTLPWATRYAYAGIISDTGLMYQYHPPVQDLDKAEMYYLRALDFSDNGYYDAWNNLRQIYQARQEWDELYDLAEISADSLVHADRSPHENGRAQARAVMKELLASGKVTGN